MQTFKEYTQKRLLEAGFDAAVVKVGNQLAAQNPAVIPGMTDPKILKTALRQPGVSALAAKGQNPGAVGAYLAGEKAAKQAGLPTGATTMSKK